MHIDVKINAHESEAAVGRLLDRIQGFPDVLANELVTWQVQDMHRQYPNIDRPDEYTATTSIWPRSRLSKPYIRHGDRGRPKGRGRPMRIKPIRKGKAPPSTRPIVRQSLINSLLGRIQVLVQTLNWSN